MHDAFGLAVARPRRLTAPLADRSVSIPYRSAAAKLLSALAVTIVCILYVGREDPIYFWDWDHYFDLYRRFGALCLGDRVDWLATLIASIRHNDYNLSPIVPLVPAYALLGGGRTVFIVSMALMYLLPACAMAARLAARREGISSLQSWLLALLYWPFWAVTLRGLPDVVGLIPLGYATWIVLESRFLTRASVASGARLGLSLWLAFLLRRWYAYACISLEITTVAFAAWMILRGGVDRTRMLQRATAAFAANLAALAAGLATFQAPLVERILRTRYADIYDAYQKPFLETAQDFVALSGLLLLLAIGAGLVRAARTRNAEIGFMSAAAALTAVFFLRTQAPSVQHLLPLFFWAFPAFVYGAAWPCGPGSRLRASIGWPVVLATALAGWLAVFVPSARQATAIAGPLLPTASYAPLRLDNRAAYEALATDLGNALRDPNDKLAVFASSPSLSGSMLASFDPAVAGAIIEISQIDKRDGLRLAPFGARFAIATSTPALHLPARGQRVVQIADDMIAEGEGPGTAYRRVAGPYHLDGGVEASLYQRDRPWSNQDSDAILRAIHVYYPDWMLDNGEIGPTAPHRP